jgi:hypothetical protein
MRKEFGQSFIVHTVGVGSFDTTCLEKIANASGGQFHKNEAGRRCNSQVASGVGFQPTQKNINMIYNRTWNTVWFPA